MKPGGNEGGSGLFLFGGGLILAALGLYFLLHSVHVVSDGAGIISRAMSGRGRGGGGGGGMRETTSMGVVFVPFFIGVGALFYDATKKWAWGLAGVGFLILIIEIFSRIGFRMDIKMAHLVVMLVMIASGAGMVAKAYRTGGGSEGSQEEEEKGGGS